MFSCGVTVLQNMVSSSNIFAVLHHWIPGSINHHTMAMAGKANYTKNMCLNDCDNNGVES